MKRIAHKPRRTLARANLRLVQDQLNDDNDEVVLNISIDELVAVALHIKRYRATKSQEQRNYAPSEYIRVSRARGDTHTVGHAERCGFADGTLVRAVRVLGHTAAFDTAWHVRALGQLPSNLRRFSPSETHNQLSFLEQMSHGAADFSIAHEFDIMKR
jgi:hypothetical protein